MAGASLIAITFTLFVSGCSTPAKRTSGTAPQRITAPAAAVNAPAPAAQPVANGTGVVNVPSPTAQQSATTNMAAAMRPIVVQFSTNGFVGGVECLFQNTRDKDLEITIATVANEVEVYKYTFDVQSKNEEVIELLPRTYTYSYTVEDDPTVYPVVAGTLSFTVTKSPTHGFKGKKPYYGGLRFSE